MKIELLKKIENKSAKIGIVGLGYVGLPLLVAFGEAGFSVTGYDRSTMKVDTIQAGISDIIDISSERVLKLIKNNMILVSSEKACLNGLDIIIICVPTPLTKSYEPDTSYITEAINDIKSTWENGKCIILESTTYPGTSREMIHDVLTNVGYKIDRDYLVAYSPERVDPGNKKYCVENTPKVVGGISIDSMSVAEAVYGTIVNQVVPVKSTEVAEMSKLLENSFRSINIAFINEMALLCERMNIDIWETIEASATKPFGYMKFTPGPGVGGHCIPLDPLYLSWKAKEYNCFNRFISLSHEINQSMPEHIVIKAMEALNQHSKSINNSKIIIIGMAYKEEINDVRESPSLKIYDSLKSLGANIQYCDPLVPSFIDEKGNKQESLELEKFRASDFDLVIFLACHSIFDLEQIAMDSKMILDTKNILSNHYPEKTVQVGTKSLVNTKVEEV